MNYIFNVAGEQIALSARSVLIIYVLANSNNAKSINSDIFDDRDLEESDIQALIKFIAGGILMEDGIVKFREPEHVSFIASIPGPGIEPATPNKK